MTNREPMDERLRIDRQSDLSQERLGVRVSPAAANEPESPGPPSEEDIGGNVEVIAEIQLLVNQGDAGSQRGAHRIKLARTATHQNFAAVRSLYPGEVFHDRAFARPVFADDRQDLT